MAGILNVGYSELREAAQLARSLAESVDARANVGILLQRHLWGDTDSILLADRFAANYDLAQSTLAEVLHAHASDLDAAVEQYAEADKLCVASAEHTSIPRTPTSGSSSGMRPV